MDILGKILTLLLVLACVLMMSGVADPTAVPETVVLPQPAEGWAESYLAFLEGNFDIFSALWPEGISGLGFIDLDLDGTPELVVFDQGAAATMGAHLFDLADGKIYCVSSVTDGSAGAFDSTYLTDVGVCASYFESFRLSRTAEGWCFWVDSANSTMEMAWDEFVRFDCSDGILTPVSVCARYLETDMSSGAVITEDYVVAGDASDKAAYEAASNVYLNGQDAGYEAKGVFLWNDMDSYDTTTHDGFVALARAAADAYVPITDTVTLSAAAD